MRSYVELVKGVADLVGLMDLAAHAGMCLDYSPHVGSYHSGQIEAGSSIITNGCFICKLSQIFHICLVFLVFAALAGHPKPTYIAILWTYAH